MGVNAFGSPGTHRVRVLHIVLELDYGGLQRLVADLARRIDRTRFETHILALKYLGRFAEGLDDVATLHDAIPLPRYTMLWPRRLARRIRDIAPDVVHTHSGVWYKASLAARWARVPRLIHTDHGRHSPDPWRARLLDGIAARRTDVVVAVSEPLARQLARTVVSDTSRIRVVTNGIDTKAYAPRVDPGNLRRELGLAPARAIIGTIGRLDRIKGYDVMVEAFALLRERLGAVPLPALVIAGDGPERERLAQRAAALGVSDGVHLLGWRDDIHDLHAAFTLFTLSSRSEGTSVSLLAAMSAGVCPVVTDVGGNRDVLGPELAHRLVEPEDPAALAAAWHVALQESQTRTADEALARGRVMERFSLSGMVRAYESLYSTS